MTALSKPRMLVVGGVTALGVAAVGGFAAIHHSTALAASPAPVQAVQLAAAPANPSTASPAEPTTPETAPEAPEATTPDTGAADAAGGHADNPADANVDHQFNGNE